MSNDRARDARTLWLQWTLANAAGWSIGWSVGWPAATVMFAVVGNDVADALMVGVIGAVVGVARWSAARKSRDDHRAWRRVGRAVGSAAATMLPLSAAVVADWFAGGEGYPSLLATVGALMGLVQWLCLRRWVALSGWWILASSTGTAAGWSVGQSMNVALGSDLGELVGFAAMGGLMGLLIGILQSYVRRAQSRAGWWTAASTVGWAGALPIGAAAIFSWDAVIAGAVLGAITGIPLTWMFRVKCSSQ